MHKALEMRASQVVGSTHGRGCKALRKPGGGIIRLRDGGGPAGGGGLHALAFVACREVGRRRRVDGSPGGSRLQGASTGRGFVSGGLQAVPTMVIAGNVRMADIHCPFSVKKGTDHIPENFITPNIPATWGAMEKLHDAGKVRAIGVSNFSSKKLGDLLSVARVPPAVNQVECHPGWQQTKLHNFCQSTGVHLSACSPLGSPGTTWMNGNVLKEPIIISIAEKLGKTIGQVALLWNIQMGHSVLPKSTNQERIKKNLDVYDWTIQDDWTIQEIKQVALAIL
ncbi:NADPH-dependent aldo-keto reductase, chloroplastic-like [Triticum dicoccoides]|uniref:NADPH-dependent aldo-keto reductase, chloroplastic-like n=1 Tax=Triticum dicoccoides TaxID=85692 RepID=UPI00188F8CED|nr:NADPH-dependent aldo-keto reductase, chloroplastic-like [Triticum dicoccoides]